MPRTARTGRVALVTGATHGIGYRVARPLAAPGTDVVVHARGREEGHRAIVRLIQDGGAP